MEKKQARELKDQLLRQPQPGHAYGGWRCLAAGAMPVRDSASRM